MTRYDLIPVNLGAKHTIRVEDLRDWHGLPVTCANFGHVRSISPARIKSMQVAGSTSFTWHIVWPVADVETAR